VNYIITHNAEGKALGQVGLPVLVNFTEDEAKAARYEGLRLITVTEYVFG
jgi:hypothetical protein